ncbi:MAG: MlaE family ABC transporter permease [Solirubrobacteraceae bacterium]
MATTTTAPAPAPAPVGRKRKRRDGPAKSLLRETGELMTFAGQSVFALPGSFSYFSEALRHVAMMISGTIGLLFVMEMFQGASIANVGYFLLRGIGASDFFGLLTGFGIPRFTAPLMFGYVFTAKVCCGMTAQLGAMKIQQEVDAFEASGIDPRRYLVGTRLLAVLMFIPVAAFVAYVGDLAGAYGIAVTLAHGLSTTTFFAVHWRVQAPRDLVFMTFTIGTVAVVTSTVACFYGLRTKGGPAEVGSSVARSLVVNLVLLHLIGALFAVIVYGTQANLGIGG